MMRFSTWFVVLGIALVGAAMVGTISPAQAKKAKGTREAPIVIEGYGHSHKPGAASTASTMTIRMTLRNGTDAPIYRVAGEITWRAYGGIKVLGLPFERDEMLEAGAEVAWEEAFDETPNPTSAYQVLVPMGPADVQVAFEPTEVVWEEPKAIEYPPFDEVINGPLLDERLGQNQPLIQCFVVAINAGVEMEAMMYVGFDVHPDGTVTGGRVINEGFADGELATRVSGQLDALIFDPFAGEEIHTLKYPFRTR